MKLSIKDKKHLKTCHHCKTCKHPSHKKKLGQPLKVEKAVDIFGKFQATRWG
mgnify:CR=1 FL=1